MESSPQGSHPSLRREVAFAVLMGSPPWAGHAFAMSGSLGTCAWSGASYEYLVLTDWSRSTGRLTSGAAARCRGGTGSMAEHPHQEGWVPPTGDPVSSAPRYR